MRLARHAPPVLLFVLTIGSLVCIRYGAPAQASPDATFQWVNPPSRIAPLPAPGAGDNLTVAATLVQNAIKNLPTWEENGLARYEQPELAAVRDDIAACVEADAKTPEDFLSAVEKLKVDAGVLDALNGALTKEILL